MVRSFKDFVAEDVENVFFNENEHADLHIIDDKEMPSVVDEDTVIDRNAHWEGGAKQSFDSGVYKARTKLWVKAVDYGPKPKVGKILTIDKKRTYTVAACNEQAGVYCMVLERNRQ